MRPVRHSPAGAGHDPVAAVERVPPLLSDDNKSLEADPRLEDGNPVRGELRLVDEIDELGKTVFIVGYGDYGNPVTGFKKSDAQRRAVTNIVDDAGPRRMFMKFDLPPKGTELEGVGGPGDSGGPALIQQNGKVYVAGVSSASMNGRPGQYGVTDVYTRVSTFIEWIEKTTRGVPE